MLTITVRGEAPITVPKIYCLLQRLMGLQRTVGKYFSAGFVDQGLGCGYVSFVVKSLSVVVFLPKADPPMAEKLKTKPTFEADTWPKPKPTNDKRILLTLP